VALVRERIKPYSGLGQKKNLIQSLRVGER